LPDPEPAEYKPVCPECGRDLTNMDPWAHALDHWPEKIENPEINTQAVARQKILRDMAKARGFL